MNFEQGNGMAGKILSFHDKHRWVLNATMTISIIAFVKTMFADNVTGWVAMFLISCPYPILILIAWFVDMRSRKRGSV